MASGDSWSCLRGVGKGFQRVGVVAGFGRYARFRDPAPIRAVRYN